MSRPVSVQDLKSRYFFGTEQILIDINGAAPDDAFWEFYVDMAVEAISNELDLTLVPQTFEQRFDFRPEDFCQWGYLKVPKSPLIDVEEVSIRWPNNSDNIIQFPADWLSWKKGGILGKIQIVPRQTMLAGMMIMQGTTFLPLLSRGGALPDLFYVRWRAGFEQKLPADLLHAIGMTAAIGIFDNMGDIIGGAGIASKSVSIPGISMSVSTTSSPSFAGFGARIISYRDSLKKLMSEMKARYGRTLGMVVI